MTQGLDKNWGHFHRDEADKCHIIDRQQIRDDGLGHTGRCGQKRGQGHSRGRGQRV